MSFHRLTKFEDCDPCAKWHPRVFVFKLLRCHQSQPQPPGVFLPVCALVALQFLVADKPRFPSDKLPPGPPPVRLPGGAAGGHRCCETRPGNTVAGDNFGGGVAVSATCPAVGAISADSGGNGINSDPLATVPVESSGTIYLFDQLAALITAPEILVAFVRKVRVKKTGFTRQPTIDNTGKATLKLSSHKEHTDRKGRWDQGGHCFGFKSCLRLVV